MKHISKFENFKVNEEEIFGLFTDKQKKIEQYTKELISGQVSEEFKKDYEAYKKSKPQQGLGSSTGTWMSYVYNLKNAMNSGSKVTGEIVDSNGKKRNAAEVLEEEIARMILKDRVVSKDGKGKWVVDDSKRSFGSSAKHTFGSGN